MRTRTIMKLVSLFLSMEEEENYRAAPSSSSLRVLLLALLLLASSNQQQEKGGSKRCYRYILHVICYMVWALMFGNVNPQEMFLLMPLNCFL